MKKIIELTHEDKILYGNKASSLGQLIINNINIPDGFALSTDFYSQFLTFNGFAFKEIDYFSRNREIQEFIVNCDFSDVMVNNIKKYLAEIDSNKYIVRSSAIIEDAENSSMAGMFDSFTYVNSLENVLLSIKKCYTSLFKDSVLDIISRKRIDLSNLKMGVIIQKYIEGSFSGVVFTADTKDNSVESLYINYAEGVCSNFVQGNGQSGFYKICKETAEILDTNAPGKECGLSSIPAISSDLLTKILKTSLHIENIFGFSQDIEWTVYNNVLYVLQSRPITTLRDTNFPIALENKNDIEYFWFLDSEKCYPPLLQEILSNERIASSEGVYRTGYTMSFVKHKFINGYMYFRKAELNNEEEVHKAFLSEVEKLHNNGKNIFFDTLLPEILELRRKLNRFMFKVLNRSEQVEFIKLSYEYAIITGKAHWPATFGREYLKEFQKYCEKILGSINMEDFYNLVFLNSIKARERELLFEMADFIKSDELLCDMFASCQYNILVYERLKRTEEGSKLLKLIDIYLSDFGLCCSNYDDYFNPLLQERPECVLGKIRPLLQLDNNTYKHATLGIFENKKIMVNRILSLLNSKDEQDDFLRKLVLAEKAFLTTDEHHFYIEDSNWSYLRLSILTAANTFFNDGVLKIKEDTYYLKLDEIYNALSGEYLSYSIIKERKDLHQKQVKMLPVSHFGNGNRPWQHPHYDIIENQDGKIRLEGLSSINKNVRGKILIGPVVPDKIYEDCILVVLNGHMGDLFTVLDKIKGLIVVDGSPFDHMGIITREMDIPAIYYVKEALDVLKNGDEVFLNGENGYVLKI